MENRIGELGEVVYLIEEEEIKEGKICGYKAEFYSRFDAWTNEFQTNFSNPHKLLEICINFSNDTAINGENKWFPVSQVMNSLTEAKDKLKKQKMEEYKRIKKYVEELNKRIKSYESDTSTEPDSEGQT